MSFTSLIDQSLLELESQGLLRFPKTVGSSQGAECYIDTRKYICLCSNNYLGLANHPDIYLKAFNASKYLGFGAGASRHISGTMSSHINTEERFRSFLNSESVCLFSSGYVANIGVIQSICRSSDVVFSDSLNHASIIDGCRLSHSSVFIYHHCDIDHLQSLLSQYRSKGQNALVVSEALFSMDGDIAPLRDLSDLCKRFDAALMVDEAHSLGVFGVKGTGLCSSLDVHPDILIGTLGKAFGTYGAFVSGSKKVVDLVRNKARGYIFSTAPPPIVASAASFSVDLVELSDDRREVLFSHAKHLRNSLIEMGFHVPSGISPIIPVFVGDPSKVMNLSSILMERGIFVHGIRPPSVPEGTCRLRVIPISSHTNDHIDRVIDAFCSLLPFL